MKTFLLHCLLTVAACSVFFQSANPEVPYNASTVVAAGLFIMFMLWLTSPLYHRAYFRKLPKLVSFLYFFLKELVVSNLKVAFDIMTPNLYMQPTVLALPLSVKTDLEITLLSGFICITPGSLSIDLSSDRKFLYMHTLYLKDNDVEAFKHSIKQGLERRILELTR